MVGSEGLSSLTEIAKKSVGCGIQSSQRGIPIFHRDPRASRRLRCHGKAQMAAASSGLGGTWQRQGTA